MSAERSADRRRGFTRSAFQFFLDHAGYGVPPGRVICARELARAEYLGLSRSWEVRWESESECYCRTFDACEVQPCECTRGAWTDRPGPRNERVGPGGFLSGECVCESAVIVVPDADRDAVTERWDASLGGICGADPAYRRVIRAELFAELIAPELAELGSWDAFLARVPAGPSVGER